MKRKKDKKTGIFARCLTLCIFSVIGLSVFAAGLTFAPIIGGLSIAGAPFAFKLTEDQKKSMTEAEQKGLELLGSQIDSFLKEQEKGQITLDQVAEKCKAEYDEHVRKHGITAEAFKKLEDTLKEQGIQIKTLVQAEGAQKSQKSFSEQVKEWLSSDSFKNAKESRIPDSTEIKAATPLSAYVTTAGTVTGLLPAYDAIPNYFRTEIDRTIHEAPRERTFLWQLFYKGSTNATTIIWFNRINREGGAAFIPEYGLKPLMSWTYEEENAKQYKIAVKVKVSEEMLMDFDYIESEIRFVLNEELTEKIDTALLMGTGVNEPEGVATWASAYAGTGLDGNIFMPNDVDAIRAAMLQLRNLNYRPDVLVITPTTAAMIDLTKNTTGNYLKTEIDALLRNLRIIESTRIDEGDFLLVDTSKFMVKGKGGLKMATGWGVNQVATSGTQQYASDFEMNAVTILMEQMFFAYHNSIFETSAIYDSFDNIKAALAQP